MTRVREVAVTAGLAVSAMVFVLGALALWIGASIARDPQAGGSVTLLMGGAVVCGLIGLALFALAVRRVRRRFRPE